MKSLALDIEEQGDRLGIGERFHVAGFSMGDQEVWGCLTGAVLIASVINFWWQGFPTNLSTKAYGHQPWSDRWALRVAQLLPKVVAAQQQAYRAEVKQQREFESICRDMMIGFGKSEFNTMDLENPFPNKEEGRFVHLWQGDDDTVIPISLWRYIVRKLPWIQYHENPRVGHMLPIPDGMSESLLHDR